MTGDERLYMEAACDYLKGKGFKNVLVICSPSANGKGTASYQRIVPPARMRLLLPGGLWITAWKGLRKRVQCFTAFGRFSSITSL